MKVLAAIFFTGISLLAANPASVSSPPAGSDEASVKLGDTRPRVEALLGEVEALHPLDRLRTRFLFKRCSIVFESGKVVELPVMRSPEELAKLGEEKAKAAKDRAEAARPGSPQHVRKAQAVVASLSPRFDAVVSRPGSPVIYVHKAFPAERYGLMPSVLIDDEGSLAIATSYYGGAWLFHDSVGVRIADKSLFSSILPHGKPQRRVAQAGFIEERCVFDSEADQQLVRDIASVRGKPVFISLLKQGGSILGGLTEQQFASFPPIVELTPAEMAAIRDSVELADAFASLFKAKNDKKEAVEIAGEAK